MMHAATKLAPPIGWGSQPESQGANRTSPAANRPNTCRHTDCDSRAQVGGLCRPHHREDYYGPAIQLTPSMPRRGWSNNAACVANPLPFEWFYPVDEADEPLKIEHLADGLRVLCRSCPVRNDCVADALVQPDDMNQGFRANTTRRERERIRTEHAKQGIVFAPEERRTGTNRISLAAEAFILDRARDGWGPYKIARALDESGYETPSGNPWDRDTVKDLLVRRGLYTPQADRQDAADVFADLARVARLAEEADPLAVLDELEPPVERTIAEEFADAADCMESCSLEELRARELEG